jgi:hypothetical protein
MSTYVNITNKMSMDMLALAARDNEDVDRRVWQ